MHLSAYLEGWELNEISDADIFPPSLDKAIITALLNSLLTRAENFDHYEETILARRTKHFYPRYEAIYDCLYWAIHLLRFSKEQVGLPILVLSPCLHPIAKSTMQLIMPTGNSVWPMTGQEV